MKTTPITNSTEQPIKNRSIEFMLLNTVHDFKEVLVLPSFSHPKPTRKKVVQTKIHPKETVLNVKNSDRLFAMNIYLQQFFKGLTSQSTKKISVLKASYFVHPIENALTKTIATTTPMKGGYKFPVTGIRI